MSTLNEDFRNLQGLFAELLNRQSDYLMANILKGAEAKIIDIAVQTHAIRCGREGLRSEDLSEHEQQLAALKSGDNEEVIDYGDGPYERDGTGRRFLAPIDYSAEENNAKWVQGAYPRLLKELGNQAHYLECRPSRSALFDALELEIKKYIADKGDYDEYELDRDGYETAKRDDKVEMAKRVMLLLHSVGEAHYLQNLRNSNADGQKMGVLGYSPEAMESARAKTKVQMKALLVSSEHMNLDGDRESIQGLLQRALGADIFEEASMQIYKDKRCLDSFDFLEVLKTSPKASLSM